jgi:hypothetical protein
MELNQREDIIWDRETSEPVTMPLFGKTAELQNM